MGKIAVWTNYGLDGACSYLLLCSLKQNIAETYVTSPRRFREDFLKWQFSTSLSNYETIYILDVDLSGCIDIVDRGNIVIIDTHTSHFNKKHLYSKAKLIIDKVSSTSKLLLRSFKTDFEKCLNDKQKYLVALVNDFISGDRKVAASAGMNAVYWSYTGDKLQKFVEDFKAGFTGFNDQQQNVINIYNKRLLQSIAKLDIFTGALPTKGKQLKIVSTFCTAWYDEIANHLLEYYKCDVVALVNTTGRYVVFICKKSCPLSMAKLAETLCDGSGNETNAVGELSEHFIKFTKTLNQVC